MNLSIQKGPFESYQTALTFIAGVEYALSFNSESNLKLVNEPFEYKNEWFVKLYVEK